MPSFAGWGDVHFWQAVGGVCIGFDINQQTRVDGKHGTCVAFELVMHTSVWWMVGFELLGISTQRIGVNSKHGTCVILQRLHTSGQWWVAFE